jgi:hypothetical protein
LLTLQRGCSPARSVSAEATLVAVDAAQARPAACSRRALRSAATPATPVCTALTPYARHQTRFMVADLDSGVGTLRRAELRASDVASARFALAHPPPPP